MHNIDDVRQKEARELGLGATGEPPQGQHRDDDQGGLRAALTIEDGKVVLNFGKMVAWVSMTPQEARVIAEAIRKSSYLAEGR